MEISIDILNDPLSVVGICVLEVNHSPGTSPYKYRLICKDIALSPKKLYGEVHYVNTIVHKYSKRSYTLTLEELFVDITLCNEFEKYSSCTLRYVSNPYFGCRSLEEALIRKDLVACTPMPEIAY